MQRIASFNFIRSNVLLTFEIDECINKLFR
jgi:hypothetical protein